jgi:nucleoside-diphosphate-sugar epimerase
MKRVLLTGATGFIGRQTLEPLQQRGYEVHAVSSRVAHGVKSPAAVQWHTADLLEPGQPTRLLADIQPSHVLHFAWYAVHGKYWTSSENLRWTQASLELLHACAAQGVRRLVMAGTCAEYDWQYGYCVEGVTPLQPATLYGTCKHGVQSILTAYAAHTELSTAWGRIFSPFGPYEAPQRLVASVINSLVRGQPAPCSHGNQVRDFLYVRDVASAFVALLDSAVTGAVNIGAGQPRTLREVIYAAAECIGAPDLVRLGALPTRPNDPPLLVPDVRRLQEEVGWQPAFSLERGLHQTIDWWRTEGVAHERGIDG